RECIRPRTQKCISLRSPARARPARSLGANCATAAPLSPQGKPRTAAKVGTTRLTGVLRIGRSGGKGFTIRRQGGTMDSPRQQPHRPTRQVEIPRRRRFRPALEALEDRLTPSMDPLVQPPAIHSVNGVLTATLTEGVGPAVVGDTLVTSAWTYNNSYVGPT